MRNLMSRQRLYLRGVLIVIGIGLGCFLWPTARMSGAQSQPSQEQVPAESTAIKMHQIHIEDLGLDCVDCHRRQKDAPSGHELVFSVRPDHSSCQECHEDVNEKQPPQDNLCRVCHANGETRVGPFPSGKVTLAQFSHAMHLDPQGRRNQQGLRLDCVLCHAPNTAGRASLAPGHAQCGVCHAGQEAAQPVLDPAGESTTCASCHMLEKIDLHLAARFQPTTPAAVQARAVPSASARRTASGSPYRDIVRFPHQRHLRRRDGTAIDCVVCHRGVQDRHGLSQASNVPSMRQCATCHDSANHVRQTYLTKQCRVCHTAVRADMRPLTSDPVSPQLVHNDTFRRFHKKQASAPDSQCGSCHRGFVNVGTSTCAGCHSSMRPRSHLPLRFSEIVHGRQAAFDRKSCATCHTSSFCVSCHSVPPRSHTPLATFRSGGHRRLASMNPRSCFVCHQFRTTCVECHDRQLRR